MDRSRDYYIRVNETNLMRQYPVGSIIPKGTITTLLGIDDASILKVTGFTPADGRKVDESWSILKTDLLKHFNNCLPDLGFRYCRSNDEILD